MKPRTLNAALLMVTIVGITLALTPSAIPQDRPNIVLILADDMGSDAVGAYNDKLGLETPNIDRLAERHPDRVKELKAILRRCVERGRSTPGPPQPNHAGKTSWPRLPWHGE